MKDRHEEKAKIRLFELNKVLVFSSTKNNNPKTNTKKQESQETEKKTGINVCFHWARNGSQYCVKPTKCKNPTYGEKKCANYSNRWIQQLPLGRFLVELA